MTTLNLKEFINYSDKHLRDFLKIHNETKYEILIPKRFNPLDDEPFMVFWEFHFMAYIGQRLSQIASEFSYVVPDARAKIPFRFFVTIADQDALAILLNPVCMVLVDISGVDNAVDFQFDCTNFFNDAFDHKVDAATWGLLATANDFLTE